MAECHNDPGSSHGESPPTPWMAMPSPSLDAPSVEWLREQLERSIWRDDERPAHVADVQIRQRRQSRRGTTALYTVVFSAHNDTRVEQLYIGYEFPQHVLDAEYQSAVSEATVAPALGRAVTLIPGANLLLVAFPNDRRMRALGEEALRTCVDRLATVLVNRGRRGPAWRVKETNFNILRYVPGQRLTLRCRGGFIADSGMEQPFAFIAKQYRERKAAEHLHRNLVALHKHLSGPCGVWLPQPMAFDAETGLVVMEELPGKDLMRALGEVDLSRTMWEVGKLLVTFHQAPRVVRRGISVRETLKEVRHAVNRIERMLPTGLARRAVCLVRGLAVRRTDDAPRVLLHGAFRPKHVFVHDGKLALIDVDAIRVGHPAQDIGHFLSALYYLEAQGHLRGVDRRLAVRRFLEGYSAHAPGVLQPAAVLWCTAALLVHKQARKYVVHLHEDREEKVDRVLSLAEKALAACEELRPGTPLDAVWSVLCGPG
jgi:aminoglycoside phosphotransferase (APT) family kinase protein